MEYNGRWTPPTEWVMPYNPDHVWDGSICFGASLTSLAKLAHRYGYRLVGCESRGINAFFVRKDLPFAKPREPLPAHEAAANVRGPGVHVLLVIDVDGWIGLRREDSFGLPLLEKPGGPSIAVADFIVVARLNAVQINADETMWMKLVEVGLQVGTNHVVWRRHHVAQRADATQVVANPAKCLKLWHGGG
jgi:hypothetical protein